MEIFALATRKKYRFETTKGELSVEELWDLPLSAPSNRPDQPCLDGIAVELHNKIKAGEPVSFVHRPNTQRAKGAQSEFETAQVKFNIVKYIIDVKMAEDDKAAKSRANKEKNQRILELIAQKDDEALASRSREELMAMLAEVDEDEL